MNTKSVLFASLGVSTIGGVATGSYFLWSDSKSESIKALETVNADTNIDNGNIENKLKAHQYEALDSSSGDWAQIVLSYKKVVSTNVTLKFDDFDGNDPTNTTTQPKKTAVDVLKEKCQNVLKAKASEDENYKKAEKWCIKPQTVSERLGKLSSTPLITDESNKNQDSQWEEKLNKHKIATENQIETLKTEGFDSKSQEEKLKAIKEECKKLIDKKTYEADYEDSLEKSKLWCAIPNKKD